MISNSILLVDDDESFLKIYSKILIRSGYLVVTSSNGYDALNILENMEPNLIITDMYMPKMGGIEFIERIKKINSEVKILVITGDGTIENAVEAMKKGAFSYIQKPINIDAFLIEISKILEFSSTEAQNRFLKKLLVENKDYFIGESREILEIKEKIKIVAKTNSAVMIFGESGTGKELVAQRIHDISNREKFPMVKVNCSALSSGLLESEIFGHEKGSFTGALRLKKGLFEISNGSTLFLDEIGEMPIDMQSKFLRVLQEKEFKRVGGTSTISTNFRLICATNKNLKEECVKGNFREDLYYRINVIPIYLPPLRERTEDITLLVDYFLDKFSLEMGRGKIIFQKEVYRVLKDYPWYGNIRELKNIIERLTVFFNGNSVEVENLPQEIMQYNFSNKSLFNNLEDARYNFERKYVEKILIANEWNITKASKELGLARKNLYNKIKKYKLR